MLLELACFNLKDALLARRAGADRIEFCNDYSLGGITPSQKEIRAARKKISIPLFIMIRPRGGNFIYSRKELSEMKRQIAFCKKIKCDGVVFGILDEKRGLNKTQCKILVKQARPMQCTFHRAFDEIKTKQTALRDVVSCGFTRVLTSGGKGGAFNNLDELKKLLKKAGKKITIMPGGGVRHNNAALVIKRTGCQEIHTAALDPKTKRISVAEVKRIKKQLAK